MRSNRVSKTGIQLKMFRKQLTKQFRGLSIIHTVEQCFSSHNLLPDAHIIFQRNVDNIVIAHTTCSISVWVLFPSKCQGCQFSGFCPNSGFLLVQIYVFLFIFSPFFGCFGSNLRAFSDFCHQFQVFWVGLTGIPGGCELTWRNKPEKV